MPHRYGYSRAVRRTLRETDNTRKKRSVGGPPHFSCVHSRRRRDSGAAWRVGGSGAWLDTDGMYSTCWSGVTSTRLAPSSRTYQTRRASRRRRRRRPRRPTDRRASNWISRHAVWRSDQVSAVSQTDPLITPRPNVLYTKSGDELATVEHRKVTTRDSRRAVRGET